MAFGKRHSFGKRAGGAVEQPLEKPDNVISLNAVRPGWQDQIAGGELLSEPIAEYICASYNEFINEDDQIMRLHLNTMIGALAALAGEFALRSELAKAGEPVTYKHGWVQGAAADGLIFRNGIAYRGSQATGVSIWDPIYSQACHAGYQPTHLPDLDAIAKRSDAAIGGSPFPPLTIAVDQYPQEWSPNACVRHRKRIFEIATNQNISDPATIGLSLGMCISGFMKHSCAADVMATLAAEIMIGTARMLPLAHEY